ncbi:hypothetical protein TTHERM_00100070 (macronuclear) [Tetrahymena thermophila SB210]|uniref:Uncharacterized protein n=1 Tax=Tetrahymena thermophila (strain SB210) TaxID=312017 RepID=Q234U3_TETTS|nr:hypothetical protein TTHERM_00100070 [Tetrahymena thermophila SB210]EAR91910.1 hypothetical protein TTHERM_00100070 [Tetrahymena thermophila SB210]|eukprot:XP_001012155.1 hypothetical protein TTHERM_00100070 [Tetrahymena thermophila SB210]
MLNHFVEKLCCEHAIEQRIDKNNQENKTPIFNAHRFIQSQHDSNTHQQEIICYSDQYYHRIYNCQSVVEFKGKTRKEVHIKAEHISLKQIERNKKK